MQPMGPLNRCSLNVPVLEQDIFRRQAANQADDTYLVHSCTIDH